MFAELLSKSNLLIVACKGVVDKEPWLYETANAPCPTFQIHETRRDYPWVQYRGNSRDFKYSRYAFKNPRESFAEMYASYFASGGTKMVPEHKVWFENNVQDAKETLTNIENKKRAKRMSRIVDNRKY